MIRIASWNVNGLRAIQKKGSGLLSEWMQSFSPSVLCVQETKGKAEQFEGSLLPSGYTPFFSSASRKGYAGTLTLTKFPPISIHEGIGSPLHDDEGRSITLEFEKFVIINVYVPNTGHRLGAMQFRDEWDRALVQYVRATKERLGKPVIIGDFNVAHTPLDLAQPDYHDGRSGFSQLERDGFRRILTLDEEGSEEDGERKVELVDSFRFVNGNIDQCYTYWDYRLRARSRNVGWRIDYILVDSLLAPSVRKAEIHGEVEGSDHCPRVVSTFRSAPHNLRPLRPEVDEHQEHLSIVIDWVYYLPPHFS